MVLTDVASDGDLVHLVLMDDYPQTFLSTKPENFEKDLEQYRPQVLLFAFRSLETSEACYLDMHKQSKLINELPHISLVLCDKDDVRRSYELCKSDFFDDYVLFWPIAHDARRLSMSIHLALRSLNNQNSCAKMTQITAQARRIAELDSQLEKAMQTGRMHTAHAQSAVRQAQKQVDNALSSFMRASTEQRGAESPAATLPEQIRAEITRKNEFEVQPSLREVDETVGQLEHWINSLKAELTGPLEAARLMALKSKRMRPYILVVDDDDLMRKLLTRVLTAEDYDVDAASNAFAALKLLQTGVPDLILMDVQMPSISGIQLTRRLREIDTYAAIPVLMLTGRGERQVILDSRAAGATDFIVKPFEREVLLGKLKQHIESGKPPNARALLHDAPKFTTDHARTAA